MIAFKDIPYRANKSNYFSILVKHIGLKLEDFKTKAIMKKLKTQICYSPELKTHEYLGYISLHLFFLLNIGRVFTFIVVNL